MKISKGQIFNLMDTNGRRNDVINALQGYLHILNDINDMGMPWQSIPNSLAQYEFYKRAIDLSPDVFREHKPFDRLCDKLHSKPEFYAAIDTGNIKWIRDNYLKYGELMGEFDKGIEDRARHYTSTLVKIGFADETRNVSEIGRMLLNADNIKKDALENTLPIDIVNVIYLRQLLKLRVFENDENRYYSPFLMAIFVLLKKNRVSEREFFEIVQGVSPYDDIEDIEKYIMEYKEGDIIEKMEIEVPSEVKSKRVLPQKVFLKYFKNRKSSSTIVEAYLKYYKLLYEFYTDRNSSSMDRLLTFYESKKDTLNKAFGFGKNIYEIKTGERPTVNDFVSNIEFFDGNLNENLYISFMRSKYFDALSEYSDTTMRIFKASGIISFENGYVELEYKELCKCIFDETIIKSYIIGTVSSDINEHYDSYEEYEGGSISFFYRDYPLAEIFEYDETKIGDILSKVKDVYVATDVADIARKVMTQRQMEFSKHIEKVFPKSRVVEILGLFRDRKNDKKIKTMVSTDATVPTIYEFIVGIAWYYFSGRRIDILSGFNLTLSANFEPLVHAGGGQGDIVIYEEDKVVMLEATLMNKNSQKRGEWEPVLRHSVNLKVHEEIEGTNRKVTTFFVADEFDCNTINIWKAIASVPLQSSVNKDRFTDNVIIMPISSEELGRLVEKDEEYEQIIEKVRSLFELGKSDFDMNWRNNFVGEIGL